MYNIKWNNICLTGLPKGEERQKWKKSYLKKWWLKTFLTWEKKDIQIEESLSFKQEEPKEAHTKTHWN